MRQINIHIRHKRWWLEHHSTTQDDLTDPGARPNQSSTHERRIVRRPMARALWQPARWYQLDWTSANAVKCTMYVLLTFLASLNNSSNLGFHLHYWSLSWNKDIIATLSYTYAHKHVHKATQTQCSRQILVTVANGSQSWNGPNSWDITDLWNSKLQILPLWHYNLTYIHVHASTAHAGKST